ncbi:SMI1/KNR4 family protein [Mycolicibacterium sp. HK-90]|uniref:SMI1/KNR4 family protein n=1 Tax=Mycolicibacterium sp. HK-90 TaxID=3056937 RepID=UPI00265A1E1F|nr:SMI1/KNR4 family protein [Mycolicibacterium sp. HK-90]WKG03450.1 SMI1/KNR4 family protein [Mycolicibacterium sp. HK-90]
MGVVESAARLFELLSAAGDEFTRYLRPGLSTEQIDDLLGRAGLPQPPSDVREFYRAFNLVPGYQYELDQPLFYGIYWLLSFEDALAEWDHRRSNDYAEPPWQDAFPFLQEDGNVFLVETQADENGDHRVIDDFLGDIPAATFSNLAAMFDTFTEWLSSGALPADHGRVPGFYEGDKRHVYEVAARLNPGISYWADLLSQQRDTN